MTKTFLSIKIEPERLFGYVLKAILKGEPLRLTCNENDNNNPQAPKYTSKEGVDVWVMESKYQ
jgi:hypothetical protein